MAVHCREAKAAHVAVVRARMGLVRCGSRQNVALGRETRWLIPANGGGVRQDR
jgi:hypothetical protein